MSTPTTKPVQPKVFVTKSALLAMVNEVLSHPNIETAFGLWGVIMKDNMSVIVTHVIMPIPEDIERLYANVAFGGDGQVEALRWLTANESLLRKYLGNKLSGTCAYLYKGHSHHQLKFNEYSGTDITSIKDAVKVDGLTVAVGPLILLLEPGKWKFKKGFGHVTIDEHTSVKIMFYYYSKAMLDAGQTEPILVTPKIIDANAAPALPPLGWRFTDEANFFEQMRHFRHFGATVNISYREVKNGPPMEIVFTLSKANWRGDLVIVTPWNFPEAPPEFHVIPTDGKTATEQADYPDEAGLLEGPLWNPGEDIVEAIYRLEARGEL